MAVNNNYPNRDFSGGSGNDNEFDSGFAGGNSTTDYNGSFGGQSLGSYDASSQNNNSFAGNNGFGENSFNSNNSFGGSSMYGGDDPNYDPNAPLYHPEPMGYDPNAPLYHPENSFRSSSSVSTATRPAKNKTQSVIIIALILVAAVVLSFVAYKVFFSKRTLKQYADSSEGKRTFSQIKNDFNTGNYNMKSFDIYVEGDDILVYEAEYNITGISAADRASVDKYMELATPSLKKEIQTMMDSEKLTQFSIKFIFKNKDGNTITEYTIAP